MYTRFVTCFLFLVFSLSCAAAKPLFQPFWVTLTLDSVAKTEMYLCYQDETGQLWMAENDLNTIGFPKSGRKPLRFREKNYYRLNDYEGIEYHLDEHLLVLALQTPMAWHNTVIQTEIPLENKDLRPPNPGFFLNYDVNAGYNTDTQFNSFNERIYSAAFSEAGLFTHYGVGTSGFLINGFDPFQQTKDFVRLDTAWTLDQPERIATWRVGDSINSGLSWNGGVRFAGIQYATNFNTQPTLVTFPQPSIRGEAVVPSSIDILVNGAQTYHHQVNRGSYYLSQIPVVTGLGTMQIMTTDLLGRQQISYFSYYASPTLLKPGLSNYSYEMGNVRQGYGYESFDYGRFLGVGTYSLGLTERYTAGVHAELLKDQQTLGLSNNYLLGTLGVLSFGVGASRANGDRHCRMSNIKRGLGGLVNLGFTRQASFLSYGVQTTLASSDYVQIGTYDGMGYPNVTIQSFIGVGTANLGSVSLTYTSLNNTLLTHNKFINSAFNQSQIIPYQYLQPNADLLMISYNKELFHRFSFTLSALSDLKNKNNRQLFATLMMPFDSGNKSLSINEYSQSNAHQENIQLTKNLPFGNGYGYHITAANNKSSPVLSDFNVQTNQGLFGVSYQSLQGSSLASANARGSVIAFGHRIFPARYVEQAFALVEIPSIKDVGVYSRNQLIGKTNKKGYVYVPELLAYQRNEIKLNSNDLSFNAQYGALSKTVVPYRKSGVLVRFDVTLSQNILLTLTQPNGEPIPAGAVVRINEDSASLPVGYNGQVFMNTQSKSIYGKATWDNQSCSFKFNLQDSNKIIKKEFAVCY